MERQAVIAAVFTALMLTATLPFAWSTEDAPNCDDILTGIRTINFKFDTEQDTSQTFEMSLTALIALANAKSAPYRQDLFMYNLMRTAHHKVERFREEVLAIPEEHRSYHASINLMASDLQHFEKRPTVARYLKYASPIQRYFSTLLVGYAALSSHLNPTARLKILDLGAGFGDSTGVLPHFFPNAEITATDKSRISLTALKVGYPEFNSVEHDFRTPLPFANESFDFITSITAAAQYLGQGEFETLLKEVHRTLKPGGFLLFEFAPHTQQATGYSLLEFAERMHNLGFKPERRIRMKILWNGYSVYPILLQKI